MGIMWKNNLYQGHTIDHTCIHYLNTFTQWEDLLPYLLNRPRIMELQSDRYTVDLVTSRYLHDTNSDISEQSRNLPVSTHLLADLNNSKLSPTNLSQLTKIYSWCHQHRQASEFSVTCVYKGILFSNEKMVFLPWRCLSNLCVIG
jgi:hypothetical protein